MSDYKDPSPEALEVLETLEELEMAQELVSRATKRHHQALARLAKKNNLDPNKMKVRGGGGGKDDPP